MKGKGSRQRQSDYHAVLTKNASASLIVSSGAKIYVSGMLSWVQCLSLSFNWSLTGSQSKSLILAQKPRQTVDKLIVGGYQLTALLIVEQ